MLPHGQVTPGEPSRTAFGESVITELEATSQQHLQSVRANIQAAHGELRTLPGDVLWLPAVELRRAVWQSARENEGLVVSTRAALRQTLAQERKQLRREREAGESSRHGASEPEIQRLEARGGRRRACL